jgi:sporulation protein YlmC with PRC-barrel domain
VFKQKNYLLSCFLISCVDVILVGLDELLGKSVIGILGNHVGDVFGLDIDPVTWKVTHLQLKLSKITAKEIGVKKVFKTSTIRIPISFIEEIGVIINLNVSIFDLKEHSDFSINSTSKAKSSLNYEK